MSELKPLSGSNNPKDRIAVTKVPLGLVPGAALTHCAAALHEGMLKYTKGNWRAERIAAATYYDAALRHIYRWIDGEEVAPDSGVHHLGHAMACLAILLDAQGSDKLIDNRPPAGPAGKSFDEGPETIKRLTEKYAKPPEQPVVHTRMPLAGKAPGELDERVVSVESLAGHTVYTISEKLGYIDDSELLQGTNFSAKVKVFRDGYHDVDEYVKHLHKLEDIDNAG